MKFRIQILGVLLFCASFTLFADDSDRAKSQHNWSYLDIEYLNLDGSRKFGGSDRTEGNTSYELEGQYALGKRLLLYGAYQKLDFTNVFGNTFRINNERTNIKFGVGSRFELGKNNGLWIRGGLLHSKLSRSSPLVVFVPDSPSDDGYFFGLGWRGWVHERVEIFASSSYYAGINYSSFGSSDQKITEHEFGARFKLSKPIDLGIAYKHGEFLEFADQNYDGFSLSGRFKFD